MRASPTFSIVVPTFRRSEVLGRTIEALLATEYPPDQFEIIVVDGDDLQTERVVADAPRGRVA